MEPEEEALIDYADNGIYKRNRTQYTDRGWTWAYLMVLLVCTVGSVYAWFHKSLDYKHLGPDALSNASNCPVAERGRLLREHNGDAEFDVSEFWHVAKHWLGGTLLASMAIGALFLYLFQNMAVTMVWMSMALVEVCLVAIPISCFMAGDNYAVVVGVIVGIYAVIWPFLVYRWRSRLVLCGQLLCVASKALQANPFLTPIIVGLSIACVIAVMPFGGLIVLTIANGSLQRRPGAIPDLAPGDSNQLGCIDASGSPVMCCQWTPDNWVLAYWPFVWLGMMWTWSIGAQLRAYVVSGCAAQWYFMSPAVSTMRTPSTSGFISRSLGHGLTKSFGSICFSALVLPIVKLLKNAAANNGQGSSSNSVLAVIIVCLRCFFSALFELMEAITQFATVSMAITGKPFFESGRSVTGLLARHLLSSVGVWIFPPIILGLTSFMLSLVWAGVVYACSAAGWASHPQGQKDALLLAGIALCSAWLVLCFYKSVLLNVVDACYICFAMDLDMQQITNQEIHDIYHALPTGKLIVQPDEELAFGASADASHYAPPSITPAPASGIARPLFSESMDEPLPAPLHYASPPAPAPKA